MGRKRLPEEIKRERKRQGEKKYRENNKEKLKEKKKTWRDNNKDKVRGYSKKYQEKHRLACKIRNRMWIEKNRKYYNKKQAGYQKNSRDEKPRTQEEKKKNREKVRVYQSMKPNKNIDIYDLANGGPVVLIKIKEQHLIDMYEEEKAMIDMDTTTILYDLLQSLAPREEKVLRMIFGLSILFEEELPFFENLSKKDYAFSRISEIEYRMVARESAQRNG